MTALRPHLAPPRPQDPVSTDPPVTVLYHKNCPDGAVAAWIAGRALAIARRKVQWIPQFADQPLRDLARLAGHQVWVLDLCPNLSDLDTLAAVAAQVQVLDHHATRADVAAARPHLVTFDAGTSGAMLTWRHFHGDAQPPEVVSYVEDMDLWRQALPDWRPMQALLRTCGKPEAVAALHAELERDRAATLARGMTLAEARDRLVHASAARAQTAHLDGVEVRAVQLDPDAPDINSDVGNRVAEQHGGIAVVWRLKNGKYRYSLRSVQGQGPAVDALAVLSGGNVWSWWRCLGMRTPWRSRPRRRWTREPCCGPSSPGPTVRAVPVATPRSTPRPRL
jgi:hypothetical protein